MKSVKQIESFADAIGQPRQKHKGIKMKRRTLYGIFTVLGLTLMLCVSASYVDWYGRVSANISVQDVIFVDGEAQTTIADTFSCYPGNTTNCSHNISNIHPSYTYKLNFSVSDVTEGLTVAFWVDGAQVENVTISPQTIKDFNISYHVAANADPDDVYNATIQIEYLESWRS